MTRASRIVALFILALSGCHGQTQEAKPPAEPGVPAAAAPAAPSAPAAAPSAPAAPAAAPVVLGQKLAGAPVVAVADLVRRRDELKGKTVRLEGTVVAMCMHQHDWFAVRNAGDAAVVRVLTGPGFLVPEGAIGKRVRTEGRVEVLAVAADQARHYAGDHQLGDPAAIKGSAPVASVILRATGAELE